MKFIIFENRISDIRGAVEGLELFVYPDLEYEFYPKTQDLKVLALIVDCDLVLMDLDLAKGSELDGYAMIQKILKLENAPPILIITGSYDVEEQLIKRGMNELPYVLKPFDYKELHEAIQPLLVESD